jgi:hypothetical protein
MDEKKAVQAGQGVEILSCTAGNVAEFNRRLRAELPGAFDLAKELHRAGLLDGLAGARFAPRGGLENLGVGPQLSDAAEARLRAAALAAERAAK